VTSSEDRSEVLEDRATLDRFRAGDRTVLAAVYRAHAPEVARMAARGFSFRSGDEMQRFFGYKEPHEQQDVVQEVFIRAFGERGRTGFDGIHPFGAYLTGILKNVVIDDFRKRKSALRAFGKQTDDGLDQAEAPGDSAEVEVQRGVINEAVRGFVDALPEREKRFVALRFHEGLPQEEVAARMKVGRSTVRTLEARVRTKLHARLRARGLLEEKRTSFMERAWARLAPAILALLAFGVGGAHV
jgi:RNA polymerase sigma factor (sigma-70 family)